MAWATKDPNDVDWRYMIFCDEDGTNDGSADDGGKLQGETISAVSSVTVSPSGLTVDTNNTESVTIRGVTYAVDTLVAIRLSGGTADTTYEVDVEITTSGGRTINRQEEQYVNDI